MSRKGMKPSKSKPVPASESIGKTYGAWTCIAVAPRVADTTMMVCRCGCGATQHVRLTNLRRGSSKGCSKCRRIREGSRPARPTADHRAGSGPEAVVVPLPTVYNAATILDLIERRRGFR